MRAVWSTFMHNRWHYFCLLHCKSWLPSSGMRHTHAHNNLCSTQHAGHTDHITALVIVSVTVIFWLQCSGLYTVGEKFEWRASRIGVFFFLLAFCHFPQWHLNTHQFDYSNLILSFFFSHSHNEQHTETAPSCCWCFYDILSFINPSVTTSNAGSPFT